MGKQSKRIPISVLIVLGAMGIFALVTLGVLNLVQDYLSNRPVVEIFNIIFVQWAKDGRSILYLKEEAASEVFRYDLDTKGHTQYSVAECNPGFGTSPDGRRLVYYDGDNRVNIVDLNTTQKKVVYRLSLHEQQQENADIKFVDWLPNDTILVHIIATKNNNRQSSTFLLDPNTGVIVAQSPKDEALIGNEGTLFITRERDGFHLYDSRTLTDRLLPAIAQPINYDDYLYVSEEQIIYRMTVQSSTSFRTTFYRMDPKTLKVKRWRNLPYGGTYFRLAPDLRHYFIFSWGEDTPGQVAVYRVPDK